LAYLEEDQRVTTLANAIDSSGIQNGPEVKALLLQGGVRIAAEEAANAIQARLEMGEPR